MIWRRSALAAILLLLAVGADSIAQQLTTDAERTWREVRGSDDVRTKHMAQRWHNAIKEQQWSDASGKFKTNAKYLAHDPNLEWVKLRTIRGTGKERVVKDVQIPLDKLSKVCQARVRTISVLTEKMAEAIEKEKEKEAEEDDGATGGRGAEKSDEEMTPDELRGGRGPRGGRDEYGEGQHGEESDGLVREGESPRRRGRRERRTPADEPPVVTNHGPPLPAAMPPLPARDLTSVGQPPLPTAGDSPTSRDTSGSQHPTSVDELKAAYTRAFNGGDKVAVEKLIFWGESTPEHRDVTRLYIVDKAGDFQIVQVDLVTLPEGELPEDYTLNSATMFRIEYENETSNNAFRWPFAEIDGKFYLAAFSPKSPEANR